MRVLINNRTRRLAILLLIRQHLTLQLLVLELDLGAIQDLPVLFQGFLRG